MIKKLDKKYLWMIIAFVSAVVLIGGVYLYSSSNIQPDHQKEFNQTSKTSSSSKEKAIDLSGEYVSSARDKAKIQKDGKSWKIDYETEDGPVSATFSTDFKVEGANKVSTSQMKKSDGNTDFTVTVRIFKYQSDKDPLITVTMSDKDPDHEMVFANRKDFFKSTNPDDAVLDGDFQKIIIITGLLSSLLSTLIRIRDGASGVELAMSNLSLIKIRNRRKLDRPIRFTLSKLVQMEKLLVRNWLSP